MKESIEGTTLLTIVMVFLFVFTAVICVSLNYSNAFKTKNDLIKYIERHGIEAAKDAEYIENLKQNGYTATGTCPNEEGFTPVGDDDGTLFCYKENKSNSSAELSNSKYYDIVVFYKIDVPLVNKISFQVRGSTKSIYN
ncbi:MAG: hypothetical protein IJ574_05805 [Bacilli bacterium]|nr:hypothetical protein [Bacilli bacterium]